jgi:hypothetical protein
MPNMAGGMLHRALAGERFAAPLTMADRDTIGGMAVGSPTKWNRATWNCCALF